MNKENLEKIFNEDLGSSYFTQLAEVYIKDGDYKRAKKVCNIGLLINPSNNDGKFILAKIEMIRGNGKIAEELLREVLSNDSLYINAMRLLVMHYNSKCIKQVEMIRLVHQILDLLPNDEFALEILKASRKQTSKKPVKRVANRKPTKASAVGGKSKPKPKPKAIASKPENKKITIDPKMATLTFVDILIKQKQYSQASNVLGMVEKNKSISRTSITQRQGKIKKELAKEN
jgi:tetratricopeptide (TPR) repeat protein